MDKYSAQATIILLIIKRKFRTFHSSPNRTKGNADIRCSGVPMEHTLYYFRSKSRLSWMFFQLWSIFFNFAFGGLLFTWHIQLEKENYFMGKPYLVYTNIPYYQFPWRLFFGGKVSVNLLFGSSAHSNNSCFLKR